MLLSAFCLVAATAGCSGDDGDGDGEGKSNKTSGAPSIDPKDQAKRTAKITKCEAEVSTTGAYEAQWSGKAEVRTGGKPADDTGPKAIYQLNDKKNSVALYSPGSEFKGSISLTVQGKQGKRAYSSDPADAATFDIDKRGKHAQVDAVLTSISGDEIQLVAEFTCGKTKQ